MINREQPPIYTSGKEWSQPHPSASRTIQECADICNQRSGCTGFEYAEGESEHGACGTYTGWGGTNKQKDEKRLAKNSNWRSCVKEGAKFSTTRKFGRRRGYGGVLYASEAAESMQSLELVMGFEEMANLDKDKKDGREDLMNTFSEKYWNTVARKPTQIISVRGSAIDGVNCDYLLKTKLSAEENTRDQNTPIYVCQRLHYQSKGGRYGKWIIRYGQEEESDDMRCFWGIWFKGKEDGAPRILLHKCSYEHCYGPCVDDLEDSNEGAPAVFPLGPWSDDTDVEQGEEEGGPTDVLQRGTVVLSRMEPMCDGKIGGRGRSVCVAPQGKFMSDLFHEGADCYKAGESGPCPDSPPQGL